MDKGIINKALGDYLDKGYTLEEDDHLLYLKFKGVLISRFSATGATFLSIQNACCDHWNNMLVGGINGKIICTNSMG